MFLLAVTAMTIVVRVLMASAQVDLTWCLLVLSLAPWATVLGYETVAYRRNTEVVSWIRLGQRLVIGGCSRRSPWHAMAAQCRKRMESLDHPVPGKWGWRAAWSVRLEMP